jgi:hypothetical protein
MSDIHSSIVNLGEDFWTWRAKQQPRSHDDIPRIERPQEWVPDWSPERVRRYQDELATFEERQRSIDVGPVSEPNVDISIWIDHRLLGVALARARWDLDHLRLWQRQPRFYVDQTIGTVFDVLTLEVIGPKEVEVVIHLLDSFPKTLEDARTNLNGEAVQEFAEITIGELQAIDEQIRQMAAELAKIVDIDLLERLNAAAVRASDELVAFRMWLQETKVGMVHLEPIGENEFRWFLTNVALSPFTAEELIAIGNLEFDRAVVLETIVKNRFRDVQMPPLADSARQQSENESRLELEVRDFYAKEGILSQPDQLKHYLNVPVPSYLIPLRWLGVTDDLTGPSRLDSNGVSYVPTPSPQMPYFYAANARDPRAGIVHEGAHYQQLALSWRNPSPIRRHYYDSGSNEGIAFYNEELMLTAGLFADAPHSQALMYNFMRLRALRVVIDVSLAIGALDIDSATRFLVETVPMDEETAHDEAVFFAGFPGQGLTYQIGKTQILSLMADAIRSNPSAFNLQEFHDYLWLNGNVPLSLLRLEFLGDAKEIDLVNRL